MGLLAQNLFGHRCLPWSNAEAAGQRLPVPAPKLRRFVKRQHSAAHTPLVRPDPGRAFVFEEVAVRAPLRIDVVAAAEVAIIRAKQHHRRRQRISSLEMDLDGFAARGTGGVCPTSSSEGTEDADSVVGAPGPEGPPADLDPVAIRPDAQARRAGDLAVVVEANPAPPVQLVDWLDLFGGAAQIGGKFFDTHRRARSEQPPEGGSPYLPGHHFSWLTHVSDFFVRQHSS